MATAGSRPAAGVSPSTRWSVYAGGYAFLAAAVLFLLLGPVAGTLVTLLALPTGYAAFLLAAPVAVAGAAVWWAVVERRGAYTYRLAVAFGLLSVLATAVFWVLVFSLAWGPSAVLAGSVLVVFLLAVGLPVAVVVGVPLMYARRRRAGGPAGGDGRAHNRAMVDE